jgi:hypothetical protein
MTVRLISKKKIDVNGRPCSGIRPIVNFAINQVRDSYVNFLVNLPENAILLIVVDNDIYDYV